MADPTVSTEAMVAGAAASGGGLALFGRMMWGVWRGWKATARSDKLTEQADRVESAAIKRLEADIARMEKAQAAAAERHKEEIDGLYKRIDEQDAKIEDLTRRLTEAIADRLRAIEEASRYRSDHVQMENKLTEKTERCASLGRQLAELVGWVQALPLSEAQRASPVFLRATNWLEYYRGELSDTA